MTREEILTELLADRADFDIAAVQRITVRRRKLLKARTPVTVTSCGASPKIAKALLELARAAVAAS